MKNLILLITFLFTTPLYAKTPSADLKVSLSASQIKGLNYNQMQKVRMSYINFVISVGYETKYEPKTSFIKYLNKIQFLSSAYAENDKMCFFGGWPSKMSGGSCRTPWKVKDDSLVKDFGGYTSSSSCGSPDEFRCNPVLFGAPSKSIIERGSPINGVDVNFSPNKNGPEAGYCVKTASNYRELTGNCEKVSRGSLNSIIDDYKKNPEKLAKFSIAIQSYCDSNPSYDACNDLADRIKVVTGKNIGNYGSDGSRSAGAAVQGEVPNHGISMLKKCDELLKEKDIKNRNLFGGVELASYECVPEEIVNIGSMNDIKNIQKTMDKAELLNDLNEESFYQSLKALVANEIKFNRKTAFDVSMPDAFLRSVLKKYPGVKNNPNYSKMIKRYIW